MFGCIIELLTMTLDILKCSQVIKQTSETLLHPYSILIYYYTIANDGLLATGLTILNHTVEDKTNDFPLLFDIWHVFFL